MSRNLIIGMVLLYGTVSIGAQRCRADLYYHTAAGYSTGFDVFGTVSGITTNFQLGNEFASIDNTVAGPLGGTLHYSGTAQAEFGVLKAESSLQLTAYPSFSYISVYTPEGPRVAPIAQTRAQIFDDAVLLTGPDPTYDLEFTFDLTGVIPRDGDPYVPSQLTVFNEVAIFDGNGYQQNAFYRLPSGGFPGDPIAETLTLTLEDVPSNLTLTLVQSLALTNLIDESYYITDNNPFADGDFDSSHIIGSGNNAVESPYDLYTIADFSHSLRLVDVRVLDEFGFIASGAGFTSGSGVTYPGQIASVPEPATLRMLTAAILVLGLAKAGTRSRPRPNGSTGFERIAPELAAPGD